eukprot:TRINITY_DN5979_c0_g1_i2.p1 TRINITY_DN5979_c0_g1~~TRINITY_DN5979_c0_g1_i2.p1  ORF type:complete len:351 (-),score=88.66 TRINITY_DN5979_c0_g1_i2:18-1070(-)
MVSASARFHLTGTLAFAMNFLGLVFLLAALIIDNWATTTIETTGFYYYYYYYVDGIYLEQEWGLTEVRTGSSLYGDESYQDCGSTFKDCNKLEDSGLIVASFGAVSLIFAFVGLAMHPLYQFNPKPWGAPFKKLAMIGYVLGTSFALVALFVWIADAQKTIEKIMDDVVESAPATFDITAEKKVGPSWILVLCSEALFIFGAALASTMFSLRMLRQHEGGVPLSQPGGFAPLSGEDYEPPINASMLHFDAPDVRPLAQAQQNMIKFKVEFRGGMHSLFLAEPVEFSVLVEQLNVQIVRSPNFTIKYGDIEGDMMIMSNQSQLNEAIRVSSGIKSVRLVIESAALQFQEVQ